MVQHCVEGTIVQRLEIGAADDRRWRVVQANFSADGRGGESAVPGDHDHTNARLPACGERRWYLRPRRISHCEQTEQRQSAFDFFHTPAIFASERSSDWTRRNGEHASAALCHPITSGLHSVLASTVVGIRDRALSVVGTTFRCSARCERLLRGPRAKIHCGM